VGGELVGPERYGAPVGPLKASPVSGAPASPAMKNKTIIRRRTTATIMKKILFTAFMKTF